jgi:hypothetical protein
MLGCSLLGSQYHEETDMKLALLCVCVRQMRRATSRLANGFLLIVFQPLLSPVVNASS